ncbi:MAG TPA: hypothetical protein ENL34_11700 [Chloroflexi bacterium]|nr:hypothetical protein [Chloroflexota bacterium]
MTQRKITEVIDRMVDKISIREDCKRLCFELLNVRNHACYLPPEAQTIAWFEGAEALENAFGPVADMTAWQRAVYNIWMGKE